MMSIDQKKDHFKRQREEEEEVMATTKKRKMASPTEDEAPEPQPTNGEISKEFHKKMYASYIKSALEALDSVSYLFWTMVM